MNCKLYKEPSFEIVNSYKDIDEYKSEDFVLMRDSVLSEPRKDYLYDKDMKFKFNMVV